MKVKVAEASGPVLDWMVAAAEGASDLVFDGITWGFWLNGKQKVLAKGWAPSMSYYPSEDWAQGGPIIEREEIELHVLPSGLNIAAHPTYKPGDLWEANLWPVDFDIIQICAPTPLIAAMRCYVASRLGDEVDVPDELAC